MNHNDLRERDRIAKMLRRKPFDPLAPPKPTAPELMARLFGGIRDEYDDTAAGRTDTARRLWESTEETK